MSDSKTHYSTLSKDFFSGVFHGSTEMFSLSRLSDGCFVEVNQAFCLASGYSRDEILGKTCLDLNLWEDQTQRETLFRELHTHGQVLMDSAHIRTKQGLLVQADVRASVVQVADEALIVTFARDVTEQKRMAYALKLSAEKFAKAFQITPDCIVITRLSDGLLIDANKAAGQMFGYVAGSGIGKSLKNLSIWIDEKQRKHFKTCLCKQHRVHNMETQMRKQDGSIIDVLISAELIELEGEACVVSVTRDISQIKRAISELKVSEQKFSSAFHGSTDVMVIIRPNSGLILDVNKRFTELTGYQPDQVIGRTSTELHFWAIPAERDAFYRELSQTGSVHNLSAHLITMDGEIHDYEVSANLISIADEPAINVVCRNVSHQKKVERELQRSEEKFSRAFQSSPDSITISRLSDGKVLDINESGLRLFGYSYEQVIGMNIIEHDVWVNPAERDVMKKIIARDGNLRNFNTRMKNARGEILDVQLCAEPIELGGEGHMVFTTRDMTELKKAERDLRDSEEKFSKAFHSNLDSITITSLDDGLIIDANRGAEKLFGYESVDVIGKTSTELGIWEIPSDRDRFKDLLKAQGFVTNQETRMRHANGAILDVLISAESIELDKQACLVVTTRDITSMKRATQELALAATTFNTHDAIVITDRDANILRVNPAYSRITGYAPEEVIGKNQCILNSGHHEPAFYKTLWQQLKQTGTWQGEIWNRRKNGEIYPQWETITGVRDEAGEITHFVGILQDITERKLAESEIVRLAFYDTLTELPNRRLLLDRLEHELHSAERREECGALLFIDLDHFKTLNDSLGHAIGDELLIQVASRLKDSVRDGDTAARHGGDEFVVLLSGLGENLQIATENTLTVVSKIQSELSRSYSLLGFEHQITPSIGIAIFPHDSDNRDDLLKYADTAMYRAKAAGRNTVCFYQPDMQKIAKYRHDMEMDLRQVFTRRELHLYYQPQLDSNGVMKGMEALLRWQHPSRGLLAPDEFISIAEETGMILPIGEWVLREACRYMKTWLDDQATERALIMAVNVSPKQFRQTGFVPMVSSIIQETGLPYGNLMLEITEGVVVENITDTIEKMEALKTLGIRISIDDFGTGYSSLYYLKRLPLDQLKIAGVFVKDITTDPADAVIVETIVAMAQHLNLEVIAEGVEQLAELDFLRTKGCKLFQGYYFSKPLPAEEMVDYISNS